MKHHKSVPKQISLREKLMSGIFLILLILLLSCKAQAFITSPPSGFIITYRIYTYTDEKIYKQKQEFQSEIALSKKMQVMAGHYYLEYAITEGYRKKKMENYYACERGAGGLKNIAGK